MAIITTNHPIRFKVGDTVFSIHGRQHRNKIRYQIDAPKEVRFVIGEREFYEDRAGCPSGGDARRIS